MQREMEMGDGPLQGLNSCRISLKELNHKNSDSFDHNS